MKRHIRAMVLVLLLGEIPPTLAAQESHLFRIYEDNDFINIAGRGTDKGYTNGTRLDYYYAENHGPWFFMDRWFPRAGPLSVNTYNYSLMQLMVVPRDISTPFPDKNDWPYAGALILTHGLYSSDPVKEYAIQTQFTAGVIGPLSLARQAQTWVHALINYTKPEGWRYQMPNDLLLNLDILAEKMVWKAGKAVEAKGGAELQVGTMFDVIGLHVQLRTGWMLPYFIGYMGQFTPAGKAGVRRFQLYFFLKPAVQWWGFDALLQGGLFRGKSSYYSGISSKGQTPTLKKITATVDAGLVLVLGRISLSFTQKELSPVLHSVSDQTIGNISLTYGW